MGIAMLVAVPLLALILLRMLWSGSGLWFLTVGIILLGAAAVVFLARRTQEPDYGEPVLQQEPTRLPLALTGLGVFFLAMLMLPNFAGGSDDSTNSSALDQQTGAGLDSQVSGANQQPLQQQQPSSSVAQPPAQSNNAPPAGDASDAADATSDPVVPEGSQTYIVQDGDNLWDIASRFGVTVDEIIAANSLDNPEDIQIDDELVIPPPSQEASGDDTPADDEAAAEDTAPADEGDPAGE
jgi:LysM repeat protein